MCVIVFAFSTAMERWWVTVPHSEWLDEPTDLIITFGIVSVGALMAFSMSVAEFELLKVKAVQARPKLDPGLKAPPSFKV